ncbi:hypothetical protein CPB85DRAFT_399100 [Mucidula mucida]|nr:hypothetical protein CPB85DRAFT_399100 [Mucidula mucida]
MPMVPQQPNLVKKPRLEWGRPIRCTAEVTYTGAKAEEFQPWKLQKAIALLKADLTYIKLVFPKDSDIEVLRRGVVRFFWLSWEDSPLHKSLTARTDRTSDYWRTTAEKLEDLSIESIRIFENINPPESRIESTESLLRRAAMSIITPQRKTNTETSSDIDQASKPYSFLTHIKPVRQSGWGLPIRLTLEITYTGTRTSEFVPEHLSMVPVSVTSDLLRLRLPLPRQQDITVPEPGVVRCCWTTFERSPVHIDVTQGHSQTTTWHHRKRQFEALSMLVTIPFFSCSLNATSLVAMHA